MKTTHYVPRSGRGHKILLNKSAAHQTTLSKSIASSLVLAALVAPLAAIAASAADSTVDTGLEAIYVTATKKGSAEDLQTVPVTVAAFNEKMLEAKQFHNLKDLSYSIPNVKMDSIGTIPGYAAFAIRGFTTTVSVPSVDPAIGIFVDGVYLAVADGALTDTFDVADVEVMRGPQGILFGRNVIGGAVAVNTREPEDTFAVRALGSVESDPTETVGVAVTGPIVQGVFDASLSVYGQYDSGYFPDTAPVVNRDIGRRHNYSIRPYFKFTPSNDLKIVLRTEYGVMKGDGVVVQQRGAITSGTIPSPYGASGVITDRFGSVAGDPGLIDQKHYNATLTSDYQVGFGNGVITDVLGYRHIEEASRYDVTGLPGDAFPLTPGRDPPEVFAGWPLLRHWQLSDELRYTGKFFDNRLSTTDGLYILHDDMFYVTENFVNNGSGPNVSPTQVGVTTGGGGPQKRTTWAFFTSDDYRIFRDLTLNSGIRFTEESKRASLDVINAQDKCHVDTFSCTGDFDYTASNTWRNWSPKLGLTWQALPTTLVYGSWSVAHRSGGYNLRGTTAGFLAVGPEQNRAFELGSKSEFFDNHVRMNLAIFDNKWTNMQEAESRPVPGIGSITFFANAADSNSRGFEGELTAQATDRLTLNASVGYLHAHYTDVLADLNGDHVIDQKDLDLRLPFVSPWTYNIGGSYTVPLPEDRGDLVLRTNYAYRSRSAFNVNNTSFLSDARVLDGSLTWELAGGRYKVSFYGKNLLNRLIDEANSAQPAVFLGTTLGKNACFCSINKGRVIGGEITADF